MTKPIETVTLTFDEYHAAEEEKRLLPKFFVVNALGQYVFVKTKDRAEAQSFIDEEYGKGKYRIRTYSQDMLLHQMQHRLATETRKSQAKYRNENFGLLYK